MSESNVIKEFLVGLGFDIDEHGLSKFANTLAVANGKVLLLIQSVEKLASHAAAGISHFADEMEGLYYSSQRTNASVRNIKAMEFAASHLGSNAQGMHQSIEAFATFMRTTPAAEGFLKGLGVQTRDANGQLKDTSALLVDVGRVMSKKSWAEVTPYEQFLGIDDNTMRALRNGDFAKYMAQYNRTIGAGTMQKGSREARELKNEMRDLSQEFNAFGTRVGVAAMKPTIDGLKELMGWIHKNEDEIVKAEKSVIDLGRNFGGALVAGIKDANAAIEYMWNLIEKIHNFFVKENSPTQSPYAVAMKKGSTGDMSTLMEYYFKKVATLGTNNDKLNYTGPSLWQSLATLFENMATLGTTDQERANAYRGINAKLGANANPGANQINVNQKTDIHVSGGAGAEETGKAVASEQRRVNDHLTRNLQGATY